MASFLTQIGQCVTSAIGWLGSTVSAFFGETGQLSDLLPFLAIAMGIGLVGLGVKYIRSFVRT